MGAAPSKIMTWQMVQPTSFNKETKESTPGKLEKKEIPVPGTIYGRRPYDRDRHQVLIRKRHLFAPEL